MQSGVARRVLAVAVTVVMGLIVGTISVFAARSPGYTSTSVDTQRRAAWVTSAKDSMVGLLNQQTAEVQSPVYLENPNVDLLQQNNTVVVVDRKQHTLRSIDPATAIASGKLVLPAKTSVALSESTVAVADEKTGDLWTVPSAGLGSGDLTTVKPNARTAPGAVVAVSGDVVFTASPASATLTSLPSGADGSTQTQTAALPGGKLSAATAAVPDPVQLATVGSIPVVLDTITNRLVWGDKSITLPADSKGVMLQQSGAASNVVLVATDSALLQITLSNAAIASQPIENPGPAAQPVWVDGCANGAWDGQRPSYLSWCGTTVIRRSIPKASADGQLVFRVNGATVVLNDVASGDIWVLGSDLTWINNWDQIRAQDDNTANADAGDRGAADKLTSARSDCTGGIAPATPKDDAYGVRPGKPRVLNVLDNDGSSSCAISVISKVTAPQGSGVSAAVVNDGKAIQLLLPPADTAPVTLTYTVDDGAGHTATADVKVTAVTDPTPVRPVQLRDSSTVVIVGGTVTSDVLTDWSSPSGDDLFLTGASSNNPDDRISYSPNGNITVVDAGTAGSAKKTISYTISDGVNAVPGKMTVEVLADASATPVASPVLATGTVGQPISIRPLDSVFWPGTEDLTLSKVAAQKSTPAGLAVEPHLQAGTVTVTGSRPGSYYLDYQAAAGDKVANGVIRVMLTAPSAQTAAPVTMTKVAYLPTGGETLVDLTRDDSLASGGIVAVQQISAPAGSGLVLQLIDMRLAKISARRGLPSGGLWVPYTVSAGGPSATGWLHVLEVAQPALPLSPTASAISVSVRTGDAVTMPIAQHAIDPGGQALRPAPIQPGAIAAGQGLLFTTADSIRYIAPATGPTAAGTTLHTQYTVLNTAGKSASAKLSITVVPRGANTAPQTPSQATARVFVGGTVDIPLSLDGIDPDGDWAIASDIDQAPNLGLASISGSSTIRYSAFGKAGSDQLSYTVTDPFGGTAAGTVKVLVVPLPKIADPPVLSDLQASVAPGKSIAVDALAQATDPDGLAVSYAAKPLQLVSDSTGVDAAVLNNIIVIKAGPKEGSYPIQVTVQNSLQRTATATLTVKVSRNAPKIPPTAQDVLVTDAMINAGKIAAVVDVSPYLTNPGGLPAELKAEVPAVSAGRLTLTGVRSVSAEVTDQRQVLAYQVRNAESLSANAFLVVPSRSELNLPPLPKTGTQVAPQDPAKDPKAKTPVKSPAKKPEVFKPTVLKELVVDAGTTTEVKIGDYVGGGKVGRPVTLSASGADRATTGTLARKSASRLQWTVPIDAGGGAALNVVVSDGAGKPVVVAVPATIRPKTPAAPQLQGQQLQVEAGRQSDPVSLLSLVTYDRDKLANLRFTGPSGGGSGITAGLTGGRLVVSA
ncbi:MAG: cadherin-like domain-containing protein, partial [Actinomycetota bacterium]|nr:cadherin-like domain-containing protein [Actinomycetota bacterium]